LDNCKYAFEPGDTESGFGKGTPPRCGGRNAAAPVADTTRSFQPHDFTGIVILPPDPSKAGSTIGIARARLPAPLWNSAPDGTTHVEVFGRRSRRLRPRLAWIMFGPGSPAKPGGKELPF